MVQLSRHYSKLIYRFSLSIPLILLIQFLAINARAQSSALEIGTLDSIQSTTLKEKRKLWIHLPQGYKDSTRAPKKFPVLYVLDPEAHFHYTSAVVRELSVMNGNMAIPEMIIVGILNTDRTRDLTPTHMDYDDITQDSNFVRTSGGGENFIRFIRQELIPYIDNKYPTLPNRTLVGHSMGGLLAIHTLFHYPEMFDNYLALDPSMWWDNEKLLNQTTAFLKSDNKYRHKSLFVAIANTLFTGSKIEAARTDTSMSSRGVRPILLLCDKIDNHKNSGLQLRYKYYGDDSHGLVPISAIPEGLRQLYDFYDYRTSPEEGFNFSMATIQKYEQHFDKVADRFGFPFPPPEKSTEMLVYLAQFRKKMPEMEYLLKLNQKHYPNSHRANASLGDYYSLVGDKEKAKDYYSRAQQIIELKSTKNKLEKLQSATR